MFEFLDLINLFDPILGMILINHVNDPIYSMNKFLKLVYMEEQFIIIKQ